MILRHIVPNTIFPVIARAPADVGLVLITMAALSYIGFGPGPYVPEWGSLVAAGQAYIFQAPWLVIFRGAGDGARDRGSLRRTQHRGALGARRRPREPEHPARRGAGPRRRVGIRQVAHRA